MTTETEARETIDSNHFLKRLGVTSASHYGPKLIDILVNYPTVGRKPAAERFREYLWFGPAQGGGTSALLTRQVFTALGRGDECDPDWI